MGSKMWFFFSLIILSVARQNRYSLYSEGYDKCMEKYCKYMDRVDCEKRCVYLNKKLSVDGEILGPCSYDVGQNWRGKPGAEDLPGQPGSKRSKEECAQSCFENSDCQYFVFVKSKKNGYHGYTSLLGFENFGKCWLKQNFIHKRGNDDCISGSRCNPYPDEASVGWYQFDGREGWNDRVQYAESMAQAAEADAMNKDNIAVGAALLDSDFSNALVFMSLIGATFGIGYYFGNRKTATSTSKYACT